MDRLAVETLSQIFSSFKLNKLGDAIAQEGPVLEGEQQHVLRAKTSSITVGGRLIPIAPEQYDGNIARLVPPSHRQERAHRQTLYSIALTSKNWNYVVTPLLYQCIDTQSSATPIDKVVRSLIVRRSLCPLVRELRFDLRAHPHDISKPEGQWKPDTSSMVTMSEDLSKDISATIDGLTLDTYSKRHLKHLVRHRVADALHILMLCLCPHVQRLFVRPLHDRQAPWATFSQNVPFIIHIMSQLSLALERVFLVHPRAPGPLDPNKQDWTDAMVDHLLQSPSLRHLVVSDISFKHISTLNLRTLVLIGSNMVHLPVATQLEKFHLHWQPSPSSFSLAKLGAWLHETPIRDFRWDTPSPGSFRFGTVGSLAQTRLQVLSISVRALLGHHTFSSQVLRDLGTSHSLLKILPATLVRLELLDCNHIQYQAEISLVGQLTSLMSSAAFDKLIEIKSKFWICADLRSLNPMEGMPSVPSWEHEILLHGPRADPATSRWEDGEGIWTARRYRTNEK